MSTLAQLTTRVSNVLVDPSLTVFATAQIEEAIRTALSEYSTHSPRALDTVFDLPGPGREIDLYTFTNGLLVVAEAIWPYTWDVDADSWPNNSVRGFELFFDDARPVLRLVTDDMPQTGDKLRLRYTASHTIDGLDGENDTTVRPDHESLLVTGAAGFACLSKAIELSQDITANHYAVRNYQETGDRLLAAFRTKLAALQSPRSTSPIPNSGWRMDKWDGTE